MLNFYGWLRPALFRLDPERAHGLSVRALKTGIVPGGEVSSPPNLRQRIFGLDFANPVGMAAGYDKNGEVPDALLRLGFGFVEVGTVTPRPQPGNPRPRLFRLPEDRALINRLGFNNGGVQALRDRLAERGPGRGVLGINLGANKDSEDRAGDYVRGLEALYSFGDYFVVNVSSPNTPGLRTLQDAEALDSLLARLVATRAELEAEQGRKPLLLKVAPDLDAEQRADIADTVLANGLEGLVVSNTTIARDGLRSAYAQETGGLSGAPLFARSTEALADFRRRTCGRLPLVGVGGVFSGADAYRKVRAGASLVQLYTGLIYEGPGLPRRVVHEFASCLERDGFTHISEAVGVDAGLRPAEAGTP